jgi:hypothetical protein
MSLHEIGEEFWVISLVNEGKQIMGIWCCDNQEAVNECIRTTVIDQILNVESINPETENAQNIAELAEKAVTEKEITSARIQFEEASDYEFDVYTQRMWSVKDGITIMKEAIDGARGDDGLPGLQEASRSSPGVREEADGGDTEGPGAAS